MVRKVVIIRNNRRKLIYISSNESDTSSDFSVIKFDCEKLGIAFNKDEYQVDVVMNDVEIVCRDQGIKYYDYKLLTWNNAKKQWFYEPKKN